MNTCIASTATAAKYGRADDRRPSCRALRATPTAVSVAGDDDVVDRAARDAARPADPPARRAGVVRGRLPRLPRRPRRRGRRDVAERPRHRRAGDGRASSPTSSTAARPCSALVAVAAVALGLRSGSDGGPISLEAADARHLLLAPVPRREVLLRPVGQRLRAVAFAGARHRGDRRPARRPPAARLGGGVGGQRGRRRGARPALAFVAVAVLVHALGVPRWAATGARRSSCSPPRCAAVAWGWPGPGDGLGSLAMWGMRTHPVDLVAAAVVVVLAGVALRHRRPAAPRAAHPPRRPRVAAALRRHGPGPAHRRAAAPPAARRAPAHRRRGSPRPRAGAAGPTRAVVRRGLRGLARYPRRGSPGWPRSPSLAGARRRRRAPRHHAGGARRRRRPVPPRPRRRSSRCRRRSTIPTSPTACRDRGAGCCSATSPPRSSPSCRSP